MQRRTFLATLGTSAAAGTVGARRGSRHSLEMTTREQIGPIAFDTTSALLNANGDPGLDPSLVAVQAESTATVEDSDGNGDATQYGDRPIPLVAVDGSVAGFGALLVNDEDMHIETADEEFVLNVWDALVGGGTVLFDEGHDQYWTSEKYVGFRNYAEDNGYTIRPTSNLVADLGDADAVCITSPGSTFSGKEKSALTDFLDDGGVVLLHDQGDFRDHDQTANLNDLASGLGLQFRFNDCQVVDDTNNRNDTAWVPTTTQFNTSFDFFSNRSGIEPIELDPSREYEATVTSVSDGDTVSVKLPNGQVESIRVLGVDTPESKSAADAERPEEWEGLAYGSGNEDVRDVGSLTHYSGTAILDEKGHPTVDPSDVLYWAPKGSTVVDQHGGDAVEYGDRKVPLGVRTGDLVGIGAYLVNDQGAWDGTGGDFMLNLWDDLTNNGGSVRWYDNGQYDGFDSFGKFADRAGQNGYDVEKTESLDLDADETDLVVFASPKSLDKAAVSQAKALEAAGVPMLFLSKSDYKGYDNNEALNDLLEALDAGFRFNDAQVQTESGDYVVSTDRFNDDWPYFGGANPLAHLQEWADNATDYATDRLVGETVTLGFDPNGTTRDEYDRVLGYLWDDRDGDGTREAFYNADLIEKGFARVYGSGHDRHEQFWELERTARREGTGIWSESDPDAAPSYRNRPVEELFFPKATPVSGPPGQDVTVPVKTESSAALDSQADNYPLVALDERSHVGAIGANLIDEAYEKAEEFPVSTAGFENFTFLTNVIDRLTNRSGPVLIDGGHGQFSVDWALSNEDAAYYQRYLEGVGIGFEQVNTDYEPRLDEARALIVTTPASRMSRSAIQAIRNFQRSGGAVILMGSGDTPERNIHQLNLLARMLGSQVTFHGGLLSDESANVNGDPALVRTSTFEGPDTLFERYEPASKGKRERRDTISGTLRGWWDSDAMSYSFELEDPSRLEFRLDPEDASDVDFDLYVTLDGRIPTTMDYDRRSAGNDGEETVIINDPDPEGSIGVLVDAYSGRGEYVLTTIETGS